ncbi:MAG TPA: HD domain-containing protein [Polyangiaceae bacterium]|nr:HD domain-containing protein [Polyangiaceae bacterium]
MDPFVVVDNALMCRRPAEELELLLDTGVLEQVYPEVTAMVGFGGEGHGHKDLWWHTKKVVAQAKGRRPVRWAALFHDVGKVPTFSRAKGKVTFHGHEIVSARLFDKAARRTGLSDDFRKHVRFLVRHLGRIEAYESDWTDSAVRRLHRDCARHFDDLLLLAGADITTKHADKRRAHRSRMKELAGRAAAIAEADAAEPPLPKGLGTLVIEHLALDPGPEVGRIMAELAEAVDSGELPARAEPGVYLRWLDERR